ncbi:RELT-like protein 2 isoform X2 [Nelusetta ayraudi]|uniref:RELT-like protein 2 isoform X2 n=1 Tax=Nelusetta ayraudi TaxID=303726 RepID=UPI003F6FDA69
MPFFCNPWLCRVSDDNEENQDTVEQILKCIIENEANMEAFNEMLKNHNVCVRHDPRSRKESVAGLPSHHHTVHSGSDHNSCHLCAQVRSKKGRRQSRTPRSKQRPGEQTVFSVGRFRVTHHDKKLQGGPNPLAASGDQLDQSQDSAERKGSAYDLRNMFKDVRAPAEGAAAGGPGGGKRRKSVGIFGLRRGSDPTGTAGGAGLRAAGLRAAVQQQPVVLEELSHGERVGGPPERGARRVAEAGVSPGPEPVVAGGSPPARGEAGTLDVCVPDKDSLDVGRPESGRNPAVRAPPGGTAVSAPGSLPVQAVHAVRNPGPAEEAVAENRDLFDPGPLQTSTPIGPMHSSSPGLAPSLPASQAERHGSEGYPVTQTPPDPAFSHDYQLRMGSNPALISLGSSPLSSSKVRTSSSVSSLKTPTSPLSDASTPNSSGDTASESMRLDLSRTPKTERKRPGILKSAKASPVESSAEVLSASSPTDQPPGERSHWPPSPSSPMGPGGGHVTIVRAGPDSRREFSVVTMAEEKEGSASPEDEQRESREVGLGSEKAEAGPTLPGAGKAPIGPAEHPRVPGGPSFSQDKDDMVEMEDIQDCKVTQVEEEEEEEE